MDENRPDGSTVPSAADEKHDPETSRRRRSRRPVAPARDAETSPGPIAPPDEPPTRARPVASAPVAAEGGSRPMRRSRRRPTATEAARVERWPPTEWPPIDGPPTVPDAPDTPRLPAPPRPSAPPMREIEVAPYVPPAPSARPERSLRERREERARDGARGPRPSDERDRERGDRDPDRDRDRDRERRAPAEPAAAAKPDTRFSTGPRPRVVSRAFPPDHVDEDAVRVIRRLTSAGHHAYLVGGGVRDLLLGRRPKDFDVATSARPHEVKALFRNCRIIGRRFRLAHILFGGRKVIETATFRRDPTSPEGDASEVASGEMDALDPGALDGDEAVTLTPRPKSRDDDADLLIRHDNVFGDPHEDAIRRDFTINGLFYDIERREVIDYVGGLADLESRVVRTIGLPDVRFREDPVRMLRAIKFAARCDLGMDPDVVDALMAQRDELMRAAPARLFEEILRLLRGGAAQRSFWLAWETGILSVILPDLASFLDDDEAGADRTWGRLSALDAFVREHGCPPDTALLTALLLGPIEEALEGAADPHAEFGLVMDSIAETLVFPRRTRDRMRLLALPQARLRAGRLGSLPRREHFREAALVHELDALGRGRAPVVTAESARSAALEAGVDVGPSGIASSEPTLGTAGGVRRRRRRRRYDGGA